MVKDIKMTIRKAMINQRDAMQISLREENSLQITKRLQKSLVYREAKRLFCFISIGSEVDTVLLLEQALLDGKKVAVPVTDKNREMYFLDIENLADLQPKSFGLREPLPDKEKAVTPFGKDLFLVPGLAFDEKCGRLGYGGGYYDKYFQEYNNFQKTGLAFEIQLVETPLPMTAEDFALDGIVTEKRWIGGFGNE